MIDKIGAGHYETRKGYPVVILCLDAPKSHPVVGYYILENQIGVGAWKANGRWSEQGEETILDLVPVQRKPREVWLYERNIKRIEDGKWSHAHPKKNSDDMVLFREVMEGE